MRKKKTKKIGIARREVLKLEIKDKWGQVVQKEELGDLSVNDSDILGAIRSAFRKIWTSTHRRVFIESVRFKIVENGRTKWAVKCNHCGIVMPTSKRERRINKNGKPAKQEKLLFECNHLEANIKLKSLEDLTDYARNQFHGKLEILCVACHQSVTSLQRKRNNL